MILRTFNLRILIWLLIAILATLVGWQWFAPAPLATFAILPEPAAPATQSTAIEVTPSVDALWERYQQLNSIDTASAQLELSADIDRSAASSAQMSAETEKRQHRTEQQQARAQRLQAIKAAQSQLTQTLSKAKPGDTRTVITAMEQFDNSLANAGIDNPIDMKSLKRLLITADKLNQLNAALLSETGRGAKANPEKLRQLSQEIQQLLPQLQPITINTPTHVREGK